MAGIKEIKFLILIVFSLIAGYTDYKYGKIFNWTNFSLFFIGIIISVYEHYLLSAIGGIVIAFILMFPFFATGGMGAGDVKFAMATGAVVGGRFLLLIIGIAAVLILLYTAFRKIGIVSVLSDGLKDLWKLSKSGYRHLVSAIKLGVLSGGTAVKVNFDNDTLQIKTHRRIRYGVFLGLSNIIFSVYVILEQGGIL